MEKSTATAATLNEKHCRLERIAGQPYGFDFISHKVSNCHSVNRVLSDSPAAKAGLRDKQRILKVNGQLIEQLPHEAVIELMTQHMDHIEISVEISVDNNEKDASVVRI